MSDSQSPATCCQSREAPGRSNKALLPNQAPDKAPVVLPETPGQESSGGPKTRPSEASGTKHETESRAPAGGSQRCEWEGQLLQAKSPLLNSCECVCMCACMRAHVSACAHTYVTPGAPPRRAGGEVASASRCSCRSSGGGRTPGKGCPSEPARGEGSGKRTGWNT